MVSASARSQNLTSGLVLSLVVCTYRRPQAVDRLLNAVSVQARLPDETLVVDASSDSATEEVVRSWQAKAILPSLAYARVDAENRGLTRQRNYAVARTRGRLIAFLDDDTVPEPSYFREVLACFERHPEAVGVGGYVVDGSDWRRAIGAGPPGLFRYRQGEWERREDYRWRLRRLLGLDSPLPPGWIPPSGNARSLGWFPPDGGDHQVEFLLGAAFVWRRNVFSQYRFSPYFDGYGLYEDMDFCIRASRFGRLYLATQARLVHKHVASGRPTHFRYGRMVVRNGWFVWRRRWPHPSLQYRAAWWVTTMLLTACRLADVVRGPDRVASLTEALGRASGMAMLLWNRPDVRVS